MRRTVVLFSFLVFLLSLNRCGKNKLIPNICFSRDVLPIFISKCTTSGCHSANQSGNRRGVSDFTTYDGIMTRVKAYHPLLSDVYTKCTGSNPSMPKSPVSKLTSTELDYIKYWIHTGAKNSDCSTSVCDSSSANFSANVQPILNTWCVGCHSSVLSSGGYDLSNYAGVKNAISPNNRISGCINQLTGYYAMPQGGNKLDACSIGIIQKWINNGYLNN